VIRIMLIADACLLRTALAKALSHEDDLDVVAQHTSVEVTPDLVRKVDVDLFVVDLDNLMGSVTDALDTLTEHRPECAVLVLATVAASSGLRHALGRRLGAYLKKDCNVHDLLDAVRRMAAGERFIEPAIAASVLNRRPNPLTPRERDVLRLAAEGMSVRDIADGLFLTKGTVRTYLSTIMQKIGARSRLDAIRIATEENWL